MPSMLSHLSEVLEHHRGFCGTSGWWKLLSKCIITHVAQQKVQAVMLTVSSETLPPPEQGTEAHRPYRQTFIQHQIRKNSLTANGESMTSLRDTS